MEHLYLNGNLEFLIGLHQEESAEVYSTISAFSLAILGFLGALKGKYSVVFMHLVFDFIVIYALLFIGEGSLLKPLKTKE